RTLPNLIFRPARLTRQYLDGHRAPQAPPFRTFLIAVVLVFLAGGAGAPHADNIRTNQQIPNEAAKKPPHFTIGTPGSAAGAWVTARVKAGMAHPDAFAQVIVTWAQRLAILALPLSALMLSLMFFWKRRVFIFDHLIFSMHSLSFQGLLLTTVMLG